jgi:hypothetical protein
VFHITIAIGRFFEILLLDIARSLAGVIAAAVAVTALLAFVVRWLRSR